MPITLTVYQYEVRGAETVKHKSFRTRDSIAAQGGVVIEETAREVPGFEVTYQGLWRPDRNPVT